MSLFLDTFLSGIPSACFPFICQCRAVVVITPLLLLFPLFLTLLFFMAINVMGWGSGGGGGGCELYKPIS